MSNKNILHASELQDLKEIFLLANTPSYLYKNFRQNNSINRLSQKYEAQELITYFKVTAESEKIIFDDVITIYALLVAMSFKEYGVIKKFLSEMGKYQLEWLDELKTIIISNVRVTSTFTIDLKYKQVRVPKYEIESTSNLTARDHTIQTTITGDTK